jgi:hypothetical protein
MTACRRLVFLGAGGEERLRGEGKLLEPGDVLVLERRRSPWNPHRDVDRVIVGSHRQRADVLLEGKGVHPEHVRLYLPRSEGPVDLCPIRPESTRVNDRAVEPREWTQLAGGEELCLGPWRFRYESAEPGRRE